MILDKQYLDILENPVHPAQFLFILDIRNYTYAVPFVVDKDENIVLKTIFPSRKFHKEYQGGAL